MAGILSGLATFGHHIGVASSYGAFLAPLSHIAARLHAIGNQARQAIVKEPYKPIILVCAHAGVKTGEDGPTHADPQPLQLLQENFPEGHHDYPDALGSSGNVERCVGRTCRKGLRSLRPL
jgi:transketolase